jgi:ankyrin repeat protein
LIAAGAPVEGYPDDKETPLITAASYGDAEVAKVLIEAGADLEARAAPDAGGVPGATALGHAAVFGRPKSLTSWFKRALKSSDSRWPLRRET